MISTLAYGYQYSLSVREWGTKIDSVRLSGLLHLSRFASRQRSSVEYTTDSIGFMLISVQADGADGVDGKFILLPFFFSARRGKQFRIWNYVTKVFSTVPSSGLNMNGLSRVWPMSHEVLSARGRHSPDAMQSLAVHARIQEDSCFSTFALKSLRSV
jgi:hypothetical protein